MIPVVRKILALLTPRERRRGLLVLFIAVSIALVDTLGVASVIPFLAVLGNPSVIETNDLLAGLYQWGEFTSQKSFLFFLGLASLGAVLGAAFCRALGQYAILHFANMRRSSLSKRMLDGYLGQPYAFFLSRNSSDLTKRTLSDVDIVVDQCVIPGVQIIAHGAVMIMLVVFLIAIDPIVTTVLLVVICGVYAIIFAFCRHLVGKISKDANLANRERFTIAGEAFGGIKEVKLFGREETFADRFNKPVERFARRKATADAIAVLPRYFIEAIAFGGALAITLFLLRSRGDLGAMLPLLGLYAFAGYRMMPAVQSIYGGLVRLRFGMPMVESIIEDLPAAGARRTLADTGPSLVFNEAIRFENLTFCYPGADRPVLEAFDLEILAGTTVGVVGPTGAGKTTAVDLLIGLLAPTSGRILIDGVPLDDANRRAWQRGIGYVPQSIFLADASIAENIAFGEAPDAIDRAAIERAARIANIHDFVSSELAAGYDTKTGERGIRLSGGQRQRIGIARALYRNPPVLVFDEATSALDTETEAAIVEAIERLRRVHTIVTIAHRLTTVRECDQIVLLEAGKISAQGNWETVTTRSAMFRRMASVTGGVR